MPAENAQYIKQLVKTKPTGGESISEGDDHLRAIKTAIIQSFPEISSAVNSTPAELNAVGQTATDVAVLKQDVAALEMDAHGNAASCYYNPNGGVGLVYQHNVSGVAADPSDPEGVQTRITFVTALDGVSNLSHFAFNITPVTLTGWPILITVTATQNTYLSFIAWTQIAGAEWTKMQAGDCAFSMMVNDMDKSQ